MHPFGKYDSFPAAVNGEQNSSSGNCNITPVIVSSKAIVTLINRVIYG